MCEDNNIINTSDCGCLNSLFTKIINLQRNNYSCSLENGCDRPFLGPVNNPICYNTRPISLYNCQTGSLWSIDYINNNTSSVSSVFRCESIDDCCLTCRILIDNGDGTYTSTNHFFTINLNCVSACSCHPDVYIDIC